MAFTVEQLIEGHQEPVTVCPYFIAQQALELMIEHDFSQLPVVDDNNKPLGVVTGDSILRALNNFGVQLSDLHISHAIVKVDQYGPDEDLFDLLDDLKNTYAVLIVNNDGTLKSIVTSFDTTEYFRRRAEDMMYVEDIESTVKDFIRIAFDGAGDSDQLAKVITEIEGPDLHKKFQSGISHYLGVINKSKPVIDPDVLNQAFAKYFSSKHSAKSFDDLTLYEYIQLLLHKSKWTSFNSVFNLKSQAVYNLLDAVRETRNALAHFHGEISSHQRDQLHFCAEWLEYHRSAVLNAFQANTSVTETQEEAISLELAPTIPEPAGDEIAPIEEEVIPSDSRYAPLAIWLQQQSLNRNNITLTFGQIEEIMGEPLPESARKHRAWWSNHLEFSPQARQWVDAGWRVVTAKMLAETVFFVRIEGYGKAYIDFFSTLLADSSLQKAFSVHNISLTGTNWIAITGMPKDGPRIGILGFSFARKKRFRVELYIDTGDGTKNKAIFDSLYERRHIIDGEMGAPLSWERLDDGRASRIALYHNGAITDNQSSLESLHNWAVDAMLRLQKVMDKYLSEVL